MVFRDWEPEPEYHTDTHDIAAEFFIPCMRDAVRYDRITGYFSSAVYLLVWSELVSFAQRDGRIRLICSPSLSEADANSMTDAYRALSEPELADLILEDFYRLLELPHLTEPAKVLAGLIVDGVVDIRIAQLAERAKASTRAMFHDKTGLFFDDNGDVIGFRGGINETYLGLEVGGNVDSIDAWTSWSGGRESRRVEAAISRFDRFWTGSVDDVIVSRVPDVALDEFKRAAGDERWEIKAEALAAEGHRDRQVDAQVNPYVLKDHQEAALEAWEANGRQGILEHATGSGKTISGVEAIRRELEAGHRPVVLVPSALLLSQWTEELEAHLGDLNVRVHPCGDGHSEWRDLLGAWLAPTEAERVIVTTLATGANPAFLGQLRRNGSRLFLVADEAHRLGAAKAQSLLSVEAAARLGLSATPRRASDPEGTSAVLDYFGGVVDVFSLEDALAANILTPYDYEPHLVHLNDIEQELWDDWTVQISQAIGQLAGSSDNNADAVLSNPQIKHLFIQRSRVIKKASAKVALARAVVGEHFRQRDRWLVYCEDSEQMRQVIATLMDLDLPVTEYHSAMLGDRAQTMSNFETHGGVLVSISCLDEGVDVPAASHALILASSRNPREFIQRRGRVLRRSDNKVFASIHDSIVVPNPPLDQSGRSMILGEIARAMEFATHAFTHRARGILSHAYIEAGGDLADPDLGGGFEVDEDD